MARRRGKIQRTILALMQEQPDHAWTTEGLAEIVYDGVSHVEKKHRVSVLRAMTAVTKNDPDWRLWKSQTRGGAVCLFNRASGRSYGLALLKTDSRSGYKSKDLRRPSVRNITEQELIARIEGASESYDHSHRLEKGGAWWRRAC